MGSGRHGRLFTKGTDAAARPWLDGNLRQSARGQPDREAATLVFRLAGDAQGQPERLLPLHARDQSPLWRSEEHTSELQSRGHLVCRLLLEKKKLIKHRYTHNQFYLIYVLFIHRTHSVD